MDIKLPFNANAPVREEASTIIDASQKTVFAFVAENYFENYPKWAPEVAEVTPLDGNKVAAGVKGKQVRVENDERIESTFTVDEFLPHSKFVLQGSEPGFVSIYLTEYHSDAGQTKLTFSFELLELDVFMRPFAKLIRSAIKEGAENTVERIKELISKQADCTNSN